MGNAFNFQNAEDLILTSISVLVSKQQKVKSVLLEFNNLDQPASCMQQRSCNQNTGELGQYSSEELIVKAS